MFDQDSDFFYQNFDFRPRFLFFIKISIFDQDVYFLWKFRFLTKNFANTLFIVNHYGQCSLDTLAIITITISDGNTMARRTLTKIFLPKSIFVFFISTNRAWSWLNSYIKEGIDQVWSTSSTNCYYESEFIN